LRRRKILRLENKKAIFIGGASEIAQATIPLFINEGASVILVDFDEEGLKKITGKYDVEHGIKFIKGDVRHYEEMNSAVDFAIREIGHVDILVNCAGILIHKPIDVMTPEEWQRVMDINITGIFNSCKAVVPHMKARKYGRIVNISSVGGRTGRPGVGVNYAAAKAGIVGLSQTLAKELAPWNITVNAIAPGPLRGRMFLGMDPNLITPLEKSIPLGRVGEMKEIGYGILYLSSDEAAWTTGEVLDINGGAFI
jgi:NAD(P)-dependent dehydrogenase (short-subunit alcohol dehydrogenase family)